MIHYSLIGVAKKPIQIELNTQVIELEKRLYNTLFHKKLDKRESLQLSVYRYLEPENDRHYMLKKKGEKYNLNSDAKIRCICGFTTND